MSHPFEMWGDRIAAADSDAAKRELVSEAARWRAQNLGDIPAMRRATFTVSRLLSMVGERERAVSEARQLLSLCQTTPEASAEELEAARGYLQSLGEAVPRTTAAGPAGPGRGRRDPRDRDRDREHQRDRDRAERGQRGQATRREARDNGRDERPRGRDGEDGNAGGSIVDARRAAARGDWAEALTLIGGARGGGAAVLRAYVGLSQALASVDPLPAVQAVHAELGRVAGVGRAERNQAAADPSDPLAALLGGPVPQKRTVRIRVIEQYAADHPDRDSLDDLASAALRQQATAYGANSPAPWLVGIVAQAMALGEAPKARAAIDALRAERAVVIEPYDEWPFERLLRLMKRAQASGRTTSALRRGVLPRGEPDDRKLWTLRIGDADGDGMIAVAPHATTPYEDGKAEELAARLVALSARTLLLATGFGNAGLRAAAAAAGIAVLEHDGDDDAILTTLRSTGPAERDAGARTSPPERLSELLRADNPDVGELTDVLRTFRRPDRALRVIQRLDLDDVRTAAVLRAVDAASEAGRAIPEATTLAIRTAAHGPLTRGLLVDGGAVAERFSGPHADMVIDLARVLIDGGWEVFRVLRGATKRECTAHPALDTLSASMSGLWRLLVRQGDRRGEVWFVSELPPEGRAGVPLLLLEDWQRVVVLPVSPDLLDWWRSLAAPPALGWTGSEGEAVLAAVGAFEVRADPRGARDRDEDEAAQAP